MSLRSHWDVGDWNSVDDDNGATRRALPLPLVGRGGAAGAGVGNDASYCDHEANPRAGANIAPQSDRRRTQNVVPTAFVKAARNPFPQTGASWNLHRRFCLACRKIVVELDGSQHAET